MYAGRLGSFRAASTASGGTALTTTAQCLALPDGTQHVIITARNFATAVVTKFALNPHLTVVKTVDAGAAWVDYSTAAQDGLATTDVVLSSLDTLANGDALWLGSHEPFRGAIVDVDAANANASVLAAHYPVGTVMTTLAPTDGTLSAGAAFAVDGSITWAVPSNWSQEKLSSLLATSVAAPPSPAAEMFWVRLTVSAALDASTTLNSILALNRSTAYAELTNGQTLEGRCVKAAGGVGCIEALTDAGTANLIVNCMSGNRGFA